MTLYNMLVNAGLSEDIFNHESDLYICVSPASTKIIYEWLKENGYFEKSFLSTFTDQITGKKMYDIPFQYDPWWSDKGELEC